MGQGRLSCDIGQPEGLAYKIGIFERVAAEDGWRVESPYAGRSALGVPDPVHGNPDAEHGNSDAERGNSDADSFGGPDHR
ncbi:hypothetical protein ABZ848_17970 [Streptomyces sp. NPDC047081]|uniref:hypothetical protein n=1 Tax=Streptomyces sp. NPDC047081 TaxID=3154706 RepID=UPI0033D22B45